MARLARKRMLWWVALGLVAVAGVAVPLMVFGSGEGTLTVTPYSDVIRFEAYGVASLQVQIYDLSGKLLWDSGVVSGGIVDWDRTDEYGERLAYGTYLYLVQGWSAQGDLVLQKRGKLALLPGDRVQLQQAPEVNSPGNSSPPPLDTSVTLQPMAYDATNFYISNKLGVGTDNPNFRLSLCDGVAPEASAVGLMAGPTIAVFGDGAAYFVGRDVTHDIEYAMGVSIYGGAFIGAMTAHDLWFRTNNQNRLTIKANTGNVGVGTTSPAGKLDISNTANQPALRIEASAGTNLIEAYNTGSGSATGLIFRVERETGDVHAVGAFYGAGFYSGSADVAEHINVSEPVEPGDVVEIDPEKPGYFRKARSPYSRLVAGVISSDPGVVLGSNSDPVEGKGDPRPVLALAGRVPVKATTENGPIRVGDLLVASSKPGYAMRCSDPASAVGAVIGKALEQLEEGEGLIMIQVILR